MSDQVSALGIKVEAEGVEEAAKKIAILSRHINDAQEDVERAQQGVAELAAANAAAIKEAQAEIKDAQKGVKDLADANAAAIKDTDKAMIALKHSGRLFADGCAEMDERLAELKQQIVSIPDELPISTDERFAAIGAIKNFQNSIIAAYRPLEQAQQQLKFFSDDAKKTTEIMTWLDDAANRWGQSTTTLTQVSTMLTRKNIDVKQNLETIVKLAAASSQDLMATAQTYVSALQGDEGALKSLDETYRISESERPKTRLP